MSPYSQQLSSLQARWPYQHEFHQAVEEVFEQNSESINQIPDYRKMAIRERIYTPERILIFQVPWIDESKHLHVNEGFRVQMNSALGPFLGGMRFHASINLSIMKYLAFEEVFKNSLSLLPYGGAMGGSNFDQRGKSDLDVMNFCKSFMTELTRHVGSNRDIIYGGIGVGGREIGYLYGQYRRIRNEHTGVVLGKNIDWGGTHIGAAAAGYGCVFFTQAMLKKHGSTIKGKTALVSGAGNVAQHVIEKILDLGGTVLTASDSSGYIFDREGISREKLAYIKQLKNIRRGRISEYAESYDNVIYTPSDPGLDYNPLWNHAADCAFACATSYEINTIDAKHLVNNSCRMVCEGANMACLPEALDYFNTCNILFGPGKAANCGRQIIRSLELSQNILHLRWPSEELTQKLDLMMADIHDACVEYGESEEGIDYLRGANIAGFRRVAAAMLDQGF